MNSAQKPYLSIFSSHKSKISWKMQQDFREDVKEKPKIRNFMDATLNFIELMLLYRKQEKKNLRRKELIDQNCPIGTRKQEKKASVPKERNEQGSHSHLM